MKTVEDLVRERVRAEWPVLTDPYPQMIFGYETWQKLFLRHLSDAIETRLATATAEVKP